MDDHVILFVVFLFLLLYLSLLPPCHLCSFRQAVLNSSSKPSPFSSFLFVLFCIGFISRNRIVIDAVPPHKKPYVLLLHAPATLVIRGFGTARIFVGWRMWLFYLSSSLLYFQIWTWAWAVPKYVFRLSPSKSFSTHSYDNDMYCYFFFATIITTGRPWQQSLPWLFVQLWFVYSLLAIFTFVVFHYL